MAVHLGLDLLAHRLAHEIDFAPAIAGKIDRDEQRLILIDDHAIGVSEDRLELGMEIVDLLGAVLAGGVARDVVHRPGPIKRNKRDDVLELVGLELAQNIAHAGAFQLKHAGDIRARQHLEVLVSSSGSLASTTSPTRARYKLLGALQNSEGLERQEVELDEARRLDPFHVELRDQHVVARHRA